MTGRRWTATAALALLLLAVGLLAAGCGGSDGDAVARASDASSEAGDDGSTTSTAPSDPEDAMLAFAACMRQHGVDFPDPVPDAQGNLRFQAPAGGERPRDDPAFREASEACGELRRAARPQLTEEQQAEFGDAQLEFAKCMRAEGVDVPDPQPGQPPFGAGLDRDDPKVQAAMDECRSILQDALPGGLRMGPGR